MQNRSRFLEEVKEAKSILATLVSSIITSKGFIHQRLIFREVDWFFNQLGLEDSYFVVNEADIIADHIQCIYASKILAATSSGVQDYDLKSEHENSAMFAVRSNPGSVETSETLETFIENKYLLEGNNTQQSKKATEGFWRLHVYRSVGRIAADMDVRLHFFVLTKARFNVMTDNLFESSCDEILFQRLSQNSRDRYQTIVKTASLQFHPVVEMFENPHLSAEFRILVAYKQESTHSLFTSLTALYHANGLYSTKKFVETFSNGIRLISLYLRCIPSLSLSNEETRERAQSVANNISLLYVLPKTALSSFFSQNELTTAELAYAYCGWKWSHQYLSRYAFSEEYFPIQTAIETHQPKLMVQLMTIKKNIKRDLFTEDRVLESIMRYPLAIKTLYANFEQKHRFACSVEPHVLESHLKKAINSASDFHIFQAFMAFNESILQTNFFLETKVAISFHLDPHILLGHELEYEESPAGVYFFVGAEFRAFHVRFRDISRGGVRIVKSSSLEKYRDNICSLFEETYHLAQTQQLKNKDIPEGGAKAVIFLSYNQQSKSEIAFQKFCDSFLDLLIPNKMVHDFSRQEVVVFLGPDENTANFMDWAVLHAKKRGYKHWKSLSTGKSPQLGGIPHDKFGMTSLGVQTYVAGGLSFLGLKERETTKFQTGGPDGDLGSNSIKLSAGLTTAIVDSSGVLADSAGLDRAELLRLANARETVSQFDQLKLSSSGFFVSVSDRNIFVPGLNEFVENGALFRDLFHLNSHSSSDIFVPCGGRPAAIEETNVAQVIGKWKLIIEGANLFITQQARLSLEDAGCYLIKDSSANKGGVISSSLEVFACLALSDDEHAQEVQVRDPARPPKFYQDYVRSIQDRIKSVCHKELCAIDREHATSHDSRSGISDKLSLRINSLTDSLKSSVLYDSGECLRKKVVREACLPPLLELVGIDAIMDRVPKPYLKAIFASWLASNFIYEHGIHAEEVDFINWIGLLVSNAESNKI